MAHSHFMPVGISRIRRIWPIIPLTLSYLFLAYALIETHGALNEMPVRAGVSAFLFSLFLGSFFLFIHCKVGDLKSLKEKVAYIEKVIDGSYVDHATDIPWWVAATTIVALTTFALSTLWFIPIVGPAPSGVIFLGTLAYGCWVVHTTRVERALFRTQKARKAYEAQGKELNGSFSA